MSKIARRSLIALIIITIAASEILLFTGCINTAYAGANTSRTQDFATIDTPEKGSRILVVTPHCDDEALGAAELSAAP